MNVTTSVTGSWDLAGLEADLRAANREVGKQIGVVAKREHRAAARSMGRTWGKLGATATVYAGAAAITVEVAATPAGPWSIAEKGRRGGYVVRPRKGRAVTPPKGPSASATPGRIPGRNLWSRSVDAVAPAIDAAVEAVYDDALGA